ncbi:MAG: LamG domain-containing protein [Kofleriaceae bacterium]|nr:LamG domain-containing protein [Kofleriaceae bacterium]MBP6836173.1 LamG domain-containing protein [Kofleriaceae bacterium]MBP9206373.1 LamG domain-containing protein [Kofleriaceae bacterium]
MSTRLRSRWLAAGLGLGLGVTACSFTPAPAGGAGADAADGLDAGSVDAVAGADADDRVRPDAPPVDACGADPTLHACLSFDGYPLGPAPTVMVDASSHLRSVTTTSATLEAGADGSPALRIGTSTEVRLDAGPSTLLADATIELWARIDGDVGLDQRYGLIDSQGAFGLFYLDNGGNRRWRCAIGAGLATPATAGRWTHVACVCSGGVLRMYVDGAATGTSTCTGVDLGGTMVIGGDETGGGAVAERLDGVLDLIQLWSRARTDQELCAAAHVGTCP